MNVSGVLFLFQIMIVEDTVRMKIYYNLSLVLIVIFDWQENKNKTNTIVVLCNWCYNLQEFPGSEIARTIIKIHKKFSTCY